MEACAKSTGAIFPSCNSFRAAGNSFLSAVINSRRVADLASVGRGRQTNTIDEANEFVLRLSQVTSSVRIGQVPLIVNPAPSKPSNIVSQPVEAIAELLKLSL